MDRMFIKVVDSEALIHSLNSIWIGKLRLHANVARFDRKAVERQSNGPPKDRAPKDVPSHNINASSSHKAASYANVAKNSPGTGFNLASESSLPSIPITLDTPIDFPLALIGCFKDFRSIANTRTICSSEAFLDVDFKYLGGLWVLFDFNSKEARDKFHNHKGVNTWFSILKGWHDDFVVEERLLWLEIEGVPIRAWHNDVFTNICGKWGEVLFMDDSDHSNRLSKRVCIKSAHAPLVFVTTFVTLNNVTYAIRVRELCSWTPNFLGNDTDSDDSSSNERAEEQGDNLFEDEEEGPDIEIKGDACQDTDFHVKDTQEEVQDVPSSIPNVTPISPKIPSLDSDPFGLEPLINKAIRKDSKSETPEFPPGFSPKCDVHASDSINNLSSKEAVTQPGFSLLARLEETIKVGLALGLNMEGLGDLNKRRCIRDLCHRNMVNLLAIQESKMSQNGMVQFKKKMQHLKHVIRGWLGQKKSESVDLKKKHLIQLSSIDIKVDLGIASEDDFKNRRDSLAVLGDLERIRVINSIHGPGGGINCDTITRPKRSTWGSILSSINSLKSKGIDLFSFCSRKIGNGLDSSFWFDTWCGNQPLKTMYPRVFLLDTDKRCSIASRVGLNDWSLVLRRDPRGGVELVQFNALQNVIRNTILSDQRDIWQWSLDGSSGFSVASIRSLVDSRLLVTCNEATRWNRLLPIKVNVFLWRLKLNKLPSRVESCPSSPKGLNLVYANVMSTCVR
ncbi:RNA-directed DNA polymerase, eukaryota [Artemisia annua]|uniref:RNA-directed DNA polymerase, eukaryota n=1 Tax=Artemisia annua TaxID=35608 RepID=A0A2U1N494_ARTAN|nr:RNA-directed DNA polymerase, eukaryota [Artemisia annua]